MMQSIAPPALGTPELRAAVRTELAAVPLSEVIADVWSGIVVLTGTAATWADKVAAHDAAFRVPGVRDVANEIVVDHASSRSFETALAIEARRALDAELGAAAAEVRVLASDCVITLRGAVDTHPQREAAWRAVRRLDLARTVRDEIAVAAPCVTPEELRDAIETALGRHLAREVRRLEIVVDGRHVIVHGRVQSGAERAAVLGAVGATPGVTEVSDRLVVEA